MQAAGDALMASMRDFEAEAHAAIGHLIHPHHHDQAADIPVTQTTQETPMTITQQVDQLEKDLSTYTANKLATALRNSRIGSRLTDSDTDLIVAIAASLESKNQPPRNPPMEPNTIQAPLGATFTPTA